MKEKWEIDHEDMGTVFETRSEKAVAGFLDKCWCPEYYQVCHYNYNKAVEGRWELLETVNGEIFLIDKTRSPDRDEPTPTTAG